MKWYLRLIVISMAADAVKLAAVSTIDQILALSPNLLVAALILAAFSSVARNLVTGAREPTMPNAKTIGVLAYGATFGFGVIAAATQIWRRDDPHRHPLRGDLPRARARLRPRRT